MLIAIFSVAIAGLIAFAFLYWHNRATFVWRTDSGDVKRIVNRHLCQALETHFTGFLEKHGFKLISDPELDKAFGFWILAFRSDSFDLKFGGRGEVLILGRPVYRKEDWYPLSEIFALLDDEPEPRLAENDLGQFARSMEERYSALKDFFSEKGEGTRSRIAGWEEEYYWRRRGRKVPANA